MSKTLLNRIAFYISDEEKERLDKFRGLIPRSRMSALAVQRLIADLENERVELLPKITTTGEMEVEDNK